MAFKPSKIPQKYWALEKKRPATALPEQLAELKRRLKHLATVRKAMERDLAQIGEAAARLEQVIGYFPKFIQDQTRVFNTMVETTGKMKNLEEEIAEIERSSGKAEAKKIARLTKDYAKLDKIAAEQLRMKGNHGIYFHSERILDDLKKGSEPLKRYKLP